MAAGAPMAYEALSAIDTSTMLGDMDPDQQITDVVDMLKEHYGTVRELRDTISSAESGLKFLPVAVNAFALILILLTAAGVILGFIGMMGCGSCLVCFSTCLSPFCLVLSYVVTIVFMVITLFASQLC